MMALQTFTFNAKAPIRTLLKGEEPWFVAADVCAALTIANARDAVAGLDEDESTTVANPDARAGQGAQSLNLISESGLYTLILRSRKPQARAFRRWVTHEVLPALRREGRYEAARPVAPTLNLGAEPDARVLAYLEAPVRVFQHKGQPWVIAKDFCRACGYAWHSGGVLIARVPVAQKGLVLVSAITQGSRQHTLAISLEGVGLFAKGAKFPEARGFYLWMRSLQVADLPVVPVAPPRTFEPRRLHQPVLAHQLPVDPIWRPSPDDRAGFAEEALARHRRDADLRDERYLYEEHMPQLLADLMHLAERKGLSFSDMLQRGRQHFLCERTVT